MDREDTRGEVDEEKIFQSYAPRNVNFDTPLSMDELGPQRNRGDETRSEITQKDYRGGGVIANIRRVCYGTHKGKKAALVVIALVLRGCADRTQLRHLEVVMSFEPRGKPPGNGSREGPLPIVRNLAPRKMRGTVNMNTGSWSLQVEQQCYIADSPTIASSSGSPNMPTAIRSSATLTITGQPWSLSREGEMHQATWIIHEKGKQIVGIPDEISLATVVEYEEEFQADVTVTLGLPWLQQLQAFPWSKEKDDPVLFPAHRPGAFLGDAPSTIKFETIPYKEWTMILAQFMHEEVETKPKQLERPKKTTPRSFRLRGVPANKKDEVYSVIQRAFGKSGRDFDFVLHSLTNDVNNKEEMTAVFSSCELGGEVGAGDRWYHQFQDVSDIVSLPRSSPTLALDTHFAGLTLLAAPQNSDHFYESVLPSIIGDANRNSIIAIPGMAGHAYGSFKQRGGEHMWLLHDLPRDFPNARIFTYGYNTKLQESQAAEGIDDIASTFRTALKIARPNNQDGKPDQKPTILIAHSLGGILVKQVLIQMGDEDSKDETDKSNARAVRGILFFGVPSQGIDIRSTRAMVQGQANESFLLSIRPDSDTLRLQQREFCRRFPEPSCKIVSFYETELSPTAIKEPDGWKMNGEPALLVGPNSATMGGRWWEIGPDYSAPIKRNHSEMVKFHPRDRWYEDVVCFFLKDITRRITRDPGEATEHEEASMML